MTVLRVHLNVKFELMDFEKELRDRECEQTTARAVPWVKTSKRRRYSVFVLSELEESERVGRVCRALKCKPKLAHWSNDTDLTADSIAKDAKELSDKKHVGKTCGAERTRRTESKLHTEDQKIYGKGYRSRSRLAENEKNRGCEGEAQASSDQTDSNPKSPRLESRKTQFCQGGKYACQLCGVEYVRKTNLVSHMRIHTGETPYTCKICGKGFRRSDWLAKHMLMHRDKRESSTDRRKQQYTCDLCEKTYQNRDSYKKHLRGHTGERPYQCAICEKRFLDVGGLNTHLRIHWDDRPYTCSECGHGFKRSGTLDKHKRIHTGEKPYSCSICGKKLRYKYSLSMHMKSSCCQRSRC